LPGAIAPERPRKFAPCKVRVKLIVFIIRTENMKSLKISTTYSNVAKISLLPQIPNVKPILQADRAKKNFQGLILRVLHSVDMPKVVFTTIKEVLQTEGASKHHFGMR
jgi:hypothetical protein